MSRVLGRNLLALCVCFLLPSYVLRADEGEGSPEDEVMRSGSSLLAPPDEAPLPDARGEVVINPVFFMVKVEGLVPGEYTVKLDDGTGETSPAGTILIPQKSNGKGKGKPSDAGGDDGSEGEDPADVGEGGGEGDEGDEDDKDEMGSGMLKLSGADLPLGAENPAALSGLAISVEDADGNIVLEGTTPAEIVAKPEPRSGRCPLELPDPPVDEDAEGVLKLESAEGRLVVKVHLKNLEPEAVYEIMLTNPDTSDSESLGMATTNPAGNASFKVDTEKGDAVPFGVGDLADLVGFEIAVVMLDAEGAPGDTVLVGIVCEPQIHVDDDVDEGDEGDEGDEVGDETGDETGGETGGETGDDAGGDTGGEGEGGGAGAVVEPMFLIVGEFDTPFLRGDANSDRKVDLGDAIFTLGYLFQGASRPFCLDAADTNDDGSVDIADSISLLTYLFIGGTQPGYPGDLIAGSDPTPDALFCEESGF